MPTFIISTVETAPRLLADEDLLVVTTSGALWATNAAVTTVANTQADIYLSIAGAVGSLFDNAIDLTAGINRVDMSVAATGEIVALEDSAVEIAVDFRASLTNAGRITSVEEAVVMTTTDAAAEMILTNSGALTSTQVEALRMTVGSGFATLINTGTISGGRDRDAVRLSGATVAVFDVVNDGRIIATETGEAIDIDGGELRLTNTGTITGGINAFVGFSTVANSGLIDGNISFGDQGGTYTGSGGTLAGIIFGGGDTIVTTDRDVTVVELTGGGTDRYITSQTHTDLADNMEFLTLRAGAVSGTGNDIANTITGNGAANILFGGFGADTLTGRAGDDTLSGNTGNDSILGGDGEDVLSGNLQSDTLLGEEGADRLFGGAGDDSLNGGDDEDALFGGAGNDTLGGPANFDNDSYFGGAGNDFLRGSSADDTMSGGTGADTLNGGGGRDVMTGGADTDRFVFNATDDSRLLAPDSITDFQRATDRIDLSAIDANGNLAGNPVFNFIGAADFKKAGEVRIVDSGDIIRVEVNTIGLSGAEMVLVVTAPTLTGADFLL
jgi:Ca2+-binding RTX toxin-like protein